MKYSNFKESIKESVDPSTGMDIAKDIYRILVGGHPIDDSADPNDIVKEALRLSKSKEFTDELLRLIEAGKKAGLTIEIESDEDQIGYKTQQVTYSDFMKMLGTEKPGTSSEYVSRAKKHYMKEEPEDLDDVDDDKEYDEEDDIDDSVEEYGDISDNEIETIANTLDDDEIIDHVYDDDEFAEVDPETGEPVDKEDEDEDEEVNESTLNEVISRQERIRRAARLKRSETKMERAKNIALHRMSSPKRINKRARLAAIKSIKQKMFKGRDLSTLSVGEKERAERRVQALARGGALTRIAMKIIPRIRKIEKERLSHKHYTK